MNYKKINVILAWLVFAASLLVYYLTLESSVSLWDCGEFIAAADKLQVVHPPGAPFFILLGRLFVMFASSPPDVAWMVNFYSAMCSALTVMLTFKITVLLAQNIKLDLNEKSKNILTTIAGLISAFALCFSDTFWFSAVEGEVYALSSFFTALVLWAALKWFFDKSINADKWLVFIAFMLGLAIGAHLLSLLVIPSIAFLYLYKHYDVTRKRTIIAFFAGLIALFFIQNGVIPGMPALMSKMELFMVNTMGMPFDSGIYLSIILIAAGLIYGIYYAITNHKYHLQLSLICLVYILIGFSSYSMIPIRSREVLPINMNHPDNPFSLKFYINREQYEERPLVFGNYYNAQPISVKEGAETYRKDETQYAVSGIKRSYEYAPEDKGPFPRMSDAQKQSSPTGYRIWSGRSDLENEVNQLEYQYRNEPDPQKKAEYKNNLDMIKLRKPSFSENIKFFVDYQMNHMYFRYFMWNFSGRQSDIQSHVYNRYLDGNWISGIPVLDNMRLGPQSDMPKTMLHNKARNKYYLLPFILGIIGMVFQFKRDKNQFWVLGILFLFTGMLINVFLNQPPFEPRERDYVHVGSFQVFCIWIGIGVLGLFSWLKSKLSASVAMVSASAIAILVPVLMGAQNWDDHDRSGRYLALDLAKDVLSSCPPNAVYFANADNDTYPLWYVQNVEGYRKDVRIINQNLLPSDWYAQQMYDTIYESMPLPMSTPKDLYKDGFNEYFEWSPNSETSKRIDLGQFVKKLTDSRVNSVSNNLFEIIVDKSQAVNYPGMAKEDIPNIVDTMRLNMPAGGIHKGNLVLYDFIAENAKQGWKRPVCFSSIAGREGYQGFEPYLQRRGMVFQLMPIYFSNNSNIQATNVESTFDLLTKQFKFGGIKEKPNYWIDDKAEMFPSEIRKLSLNLSFYFIEKNQRMKFADSSYVNTDAYKSDMAKVALLVDNCEKEIPERAALMEPNMHLSFAAVYHELNRTKDEERHLLAVVDDALEKMNYAMRFNQSNNAYEEVKNLYDTSMKSLESIRQYASERGLPEILKKVEAAIKGKPETL